MAMPIRMPGLGTTVEEVKLLRWLKNVGDPVKRGEVICEVETDKAVTELESAVAGVLLAQMFAEESMVGEGDVVAYVGAEGEAVPGEETSEQAPAPPAESPKQPPVPAEQMPRAQAPAPTTDADFSGVRASPVIKNLARKMGVDIRGLQGSGPSGQVLRADLLRAASGEAPLATAPQAGLPSGGAASAGTLSKNQRTIARRVSQSHRDIVNVDFQCKIDMSAAIAYREQSAAGGQKVCFDAIFAHALAKTVARFPVFRHRMAGEQVEQIPGTGIGVAISVGDELYTATVSDAAEKPISEIDAEIRLLAVKAREGRLTLSEMSGAVMTLSNLGMFPVSSFAIIIPPDQSASLAIGCTEETILLDNGKLRSAPICTVTLSVDHRVINGRPAGEFLAVLKETMETL